MSKMTMVMRDHKGGLLVLGHSKPADVIHWDPRTRILVYKTQAQRFNPGSRYSGLIATYGREVVVVKVLGEHKFISTDRGTDWFDAEVITTYSASAKVTVDFTFEENGDE